MCTTNPKHGQELAVVPGRGSTAVYVLAFLRSSPPGCECGSELYYRTSMTDNLASNETAESSPTLRIYQAG